MNGRLKLTKSCHAGHIARCHLYISPFLTSRETPGKLRKLLEHTVHKKLNLLSAELPLTGALCPRPHICRMEWGLPMHQWCKRTLGHDNRRRQELINTAQAAAEESAGPMLHMVDCKGLQQGKPVYWNMQSCALWTLGTPLAFIVLQPSNGWGRGLTSSVEVRGQRAGDPGLNSGFLFALRMVPTHS